MYKKYLQVRVKIVFPFYWQCTCDSRSLSAQISRKSSVSFTIYSANAYACLLSQACWGSQPNMLKSSQGSSLTLDYHLGYIGLLLGEHMLNASLEAGGLHRHGCGSGLVWKLATNLVPGLLPLDAVCLYLESPYIIMH